MSVATAEAKTESVASELPNCPIELPKPAERSQWLLARRQGIGGSDAAASVGISEWMTPLELYLDKKGQLPERELTPSMHWGTALEPVVRQEYANRTGYTVIVPNVIYQHPFHKFAIVNADGVVPDRERYYEGKTARSGEGWGEPGTDEVPAGYNIQVQHGMAVTGLPVADIAVLIGNCDFRIYHVEADLALQEMLLEQEAAFWAMVEANTPPEPTTLADIKLRWQVAKDIDPTIATKEDALAAIELAGLKAAMKAAEEREEALKARLQGAIKDSSSLVTPEGNVLATWKNVSVQPRFDVAAFKEENPDLFKYYLRAASPRRQFLLKVKG